jgi:hypothetical protein
VGARGKRGTAGIAHAWQGSRVPQPVDRETLALKAATHAYLWASAVKGHGRMLTLPDSAEAAFAPDDLDLVAASRQAMALSFVLALRNVLRAAEMRAATRTALRSRTSLLHWLDSKRPCRTSSRLAELSSTSTITQT